MHWNELLPNAQTGRLACLERVASEIPFEFMWLFASSSEPAGKMEAIPMHPLKQSC